MNDKSLRAVPRGPGGRPTGTTVPEDKALKPLSAWVPASCHDKLARVALERDVTVSSLVRQILILRLP